MTTLNELRELMEKATPGPLFFDDQTQDVVSAHIPEGRSAAIAHVVAKVDPNERVRKCRWAADGQLIASAINALPALIAIAEAAQEARIDIASTGAPFRNGKYHKEGEWSFVEMTKNENPADAQAIKRAFLTLSAALSALTNDKPKEGDA